MFAMAVGTDRCGRFPSGENHAMNAIPVVIFDTLMTSAARSGN